MSSFILPYTTLQPTYARVFDDVAAQLVPAERVWLSAYAHNAQAHSLHAKLVLEPCKPLTGERAAETAGGVCVAEVLNGNGLKVQRMSDSMLDFSVSNTASSSYTGSTSARVPQPSVVVPPTLLRQPRKTLGPLVRGHAGVSAFDVATCSSGIERYVAGGADGDLRVGVLDLPAEEAAASQELSADADPESRIEALAQQRMQQKLRDIARDQVVHCKGHVGDIRSVRFFPSGEVILSTSSDHTSRIFSALDGSSPRTLTGHSRAVLCSAAIGRGRQVITGSADGTSRIYDVSTGKQIGMLGAERFSSVNAMALAPTSSAAAQNGAAEESLHGLLVTGLSSGQVELHDLRSKQRTALLPTFLFPLGAAPAATDSWTQDRAGGIASVAWATEHMLFSGSLNGIVAAHDLRMASESNSNDASAAPASLLCSWRRNGAAVTDLFVPPTSGAPRELLVASADGLPYRADVEALLSGDGSAPRVTTELCGWEAESVEAVRLDGKGRVLGAGAEGMLRRY